MKIFFSMLLCLVMALPAMSQTIDSITGTISNEGSITIDGSGFGFRVVEQEFFEDFDWGVAETVVDTAIAGNPWTTTGPGSTDPTRFSDEFSRTGSGMNLRMITPDRIDGSTLNDIVQRSDIDVDPGEKVYISAWFWTTYRGTGEVQPECPKQMKLFNFLTNPIGGGIGNPSTYFNWNISGPDGPPVWGAPIAAIVHHEGTGAAGTTTIGWDRAWPDPPENQPTQRTWWQAEFEYQVASGQDIEDGVFTAWYNGRHARTRLTKSWVNDQQQGFIDASGSVYYRMIIRNYIEWGACEPEIVETDTIRTDDVVFQCGSFARVALGDAGTWDACLKREYQPITSWTDESIGLTVNTGSFVTGASAWLYVVTDDGTRSLGFPVTIDEGGGAAAPPGAPTCVRLGSNLNVVWSAANPVPTTYQIKVEVDGDERVFGVQDDPTNTEVDLTLTDISDSSALTVWVEALSANGTIASIGNPTIVPAVGEVISSVTASSFVDGQAATISGNGFPGKTNPGPLMWDNFDRGGETVAEPLEFRDRYRISSITAGSTTTLTLESDPGLSPGDQFVIGPVDSWQHDGNGLVTSELSTGGDWGFLTNTRGDQGLLFSDLHPSHGGVVWTAHTGTSGTSVVLNINSTTIPDGDGDESPNEQTYTTLTLAVYTQNGKPGWFQRASGGVACGSMINDGSVFWNGSISISPYSGTYFASNRSMGFLEGDGAIGYDYLHRGATAVNHLAMALSDTIYISYLGRTDTSNLPDIHGPLKATRAHGYPGWDDYGQGGWLNNAPGLSNPESDPLGAQWGIQTNDVPNGNQSGTDYTTMGYSYKIPAFGSGWHRMESYGVKGTAGLADGVQIYYYDAQETGNSTIVVNRAEGQTVQYSGMMLGLDPQNCGAEAEGNCDIQMSADDVYVDNTPIRVELGNNIDWDSCTWRDVQVASSWTTDQIVITLNIPDATKYSGGAYLFIVKPDWSVIGGFEITLD